MYVVILRVCDLNVFSLFIYFIKPKMKMDFLKG